MNIDTEDYEWLGIVFPDDVKSKVVLITPLAFYDDIRWMPIAPIDIVKCFPNNGKATIFTSDFPDSKVGRLCYFQVNRNPNLVDPNVARYSHYVVKGELKLEESLSQILDWTSKTREPMEIPALLDRGIKVTDCFSQYIYIRSSDYLYGPIRLERVANQLKPSEYLQSTNTGGKPLIVSMYTIPNDDILCDTLHKLNFVDEYNLDAPISQKDWSQSQVVIKRVLKASNDIVPDLENEVHLVDRRLRDLARLSSADGPSALHIEQATLTRAMYIMNRQLTQLHDLREFIEHLSAEHPLLKAAREHEIQLRSSEIAQQAEIRIHEQTARLKEVQNEVSEAETRVQVAQARFEALLSSIQESEQRKEQTQKELEVFEHEVRQRLARLREEPLQVLAELQTAVSIFSMLDHNGRYTNVLSAQQPGVPPSTKHLPTMQQKPHVDEVISWITDNSPKTINADLGTLNPKYWVQIAQRIGVKPQTFREYIAALLAGLIPSISSQAAIPLILSAAQVIAGGRIWLVPVPLTALTPLDLFGMIDSEKQMFIPTAGGFADIILQAHEHPQELAIVVLEGIDRVPGMPVYLPLLRQYMECMDRQRTGDTAPSPTRLNLFHPRSLASDDPYLALAGFVWPDNLLLAVTYDKDISSLPVPSICDSWFVPLTSTSGSSSLSSSIKPVAHIPIDAWKRWKQDMNHKAPGNVSSEMLDARQSVFRNALTALKVERPDDVIERIWPQQKDVDRG